MKIGFYLSSMGGSPLQVGLERGLTELGHEVSYGQGQDLTIIFNQCAHTKDYTYPDPWPGGKIAFVDSAEYGYFKRLPEVAPLYWNGFTEASMTHDTKNTEQQRRLLVYLQGKAFPYFIREYIKTLTFPLGYYPIDYPLYASSACYEAPIRTEYLQRKGCWTSWGLSHPWRKAIGDAARAGGATVIEIDGVETRVPQEEFFKRIRDSRCSMSFDGYGSSSFRLTEVLCRTVLLRGPLLFRQHAPLIDGISCVDYQVASDGETFIGTNIAEKIQWVLDDEEHAYDIYRNGFRHCLNYLTERATAQYLLSAIETHDYDRQTGI